MLWGSRGGVGRVASAVMSRWARYCGFWVLCWLAGAMRAGDDVALVGLSDRWRFLGAGALAEAPAGWQSQGFDDSGWFEGPGGFGTSYYGESTRFPNTNGWERVLLRRAFVVPEGRRAVALSACGLFGWLSAELEWPGMGPARVHRSAGDSSAVLGDTQPARFGEPGVDFDGLGRGLDPPGHQLVDPPAARRRGVFSLACFHWRGAGQFLSGPLLAECVLKSGRDPLPDAVAAVHSGGIWGRVDSGSCGEWPRGHKPCGALGGLRPGTRYQYRVILGKAGDGGSTVPMTFQTLPAAGPLTVQVLGDSGWGNFAPHAVVAQMMRSEADLVLHAGDTVYPGFSPGLADLRF